MKQQYVNLTHWGVLSVKGSDAQSFLQGQITYDIQRLDEQHHHISAICNPQGRVVSLFELVKHDAQYLLFMPREIIEHTMQYLQKYTVFYGVTMEDCSEQYQCLAVIGDDPSILSEGYRRILLGKQLTLYFGRDLEPLQERLSATYEQGSLNEWNQWLCETMRPELSKSLIEQLLPHHIGLVDLGAISFDKGCYTGQEIVARMQYRGNLKQHLHAGYYICPKEQPPGSPIIEGKDHTVGTLLVSAEVSKEKHRCLTTIKSSALNHQLYVAQQPQRLHID